MDLVIKPTRACNFKCSFCSSNLIPNKMLDLGIIKDFLLKNNVSIIIVNGGDPLMMPVQYYKDLISFIDEHNMNISISFTTNMWDWYENPDKWNELFHNDKINLCTSFQYGEGRIIPNGEPFTEELFLDIQEKFNKEFGYYLDFIAVVTDENEQFAVKNVELAKKLGVHCKLNYAVKSGRQSKMYSYDKIIHIYNELFDLGLWKYEDNCLNFINHFQNKETICPLSNNLCYDYIRCFTPNGSLSMCPALDDDGIRDSRKFKFYKKECLTCEFFKICNGCAKRIRDLREDFLDEKCDKLFSELQTLKRNCINVNI